MVATMELAELLEREDLDADEVLSWARDRSEVLVTELAVPRDRRVEAVAFDRPGEDVADGGRHIEPSVARAAPHLGPRVASELDRRQVRPVDRYRAASSSPRSGTRAAWR